MELVQDKNRRVGLIGTILFHMLLLLLFVSFGMSYKVPPEENQGGMMINFGNSGGGGSAAPDKPEEPTENKPSTTETTETTTSSSPENVQTQTTTETVELNASQNNTPAEDPEPQADESLLNALDAFSNSENTTNSDNSSSENGSSTADNGSGNGNGSGDYNNAGPGEGIGYELGGRGKVSFKKPDNPTQEEGKVVVSIVVDKFGKVVKAVPGARGSTTTNPVLYQKAKEAAMLAVFTKKLDASNDQKGTMTFVFILN